MWALTARLPCGRVPNRGQARVAIYGIVAAAMVNVRCIDAPKRKGDAADPGEPSMAFTARLRSLQGVLQCITGAFARHVPLMASAHSRAGT